MSVVLITDQRDRQLRVVKPFEEAGVTAVASPPGLGLPGGLAIDDEGNVIVADSINDRLAIWDLWKASWHTFGVSGSGQGQFSRPMAIATDADDRVYIADTGNKRIVRMDDCAGGGWTAFGEAGKPGPANTTAEGLFRTPLGIAIDSLGRVIVTDPGAGRVVRMDDLDGSGWAVLALPAGGSGPTRPLGITTGDEWIAISDVGNGTVHLFDLDDQLLGSLNGIAEGLPVPAYLAGDSEFLAVADIVANELRRYLIQGNTLVLAERLRGTTPVRPAPLFQRIGGIALGGR